METQSTIIVDRIRRGVRIKRRIALLCVFVIVLGVMAFIIYGFNAGSNAIKIISNGKDSHIKIEKVMINPKIKFEQNKNQIYDITASKAVHIDENNIELFDVVAVGNSGNIKSGNLLVSNKGNNLHFSNNPVLTIIENRNEQ